MYICTNKLSFVDNIFTLATRLLHRSSLLVFSFLLSLSLSLLCSAFSSEISLSFLFLLFLFYPFSFLLSFFACLLSCFLSFLLACLLSFFLLLDSSRHWLACLEQKKSALSINTLNRRRRRGRKQ